MSRGGSSCIVDPMDWAGEQTALRQWMVLHTRSRQEKAVARFLTAVDAEHYLPLVQRVTMTRGRKIRTMLPLFPGYVFVFGERTVAYDAVTTRRVCQVIDVNNQDQFVRELDQVRAAIAAGAELTLYPYAVVGQRCRVTRGPFMGCEGVITRGPRRDRLVFQLSTLGQAADMEIDIDLLEPA